jgi:tRNA(Ile)-lysidine synthase
VALAGRIVKRAVERVAGRQVGVDQVERLLTMASQDATEATAVDLPGCRVAIERERVVVGPAASRHAIVDSQTTFSYRLDIPGEVEVPEAKMAVAVERVTGGVSPVGLSARGETVYVAAGQLSEPLIVRNWLPGDAFRPLGLGGRKKLQDLFVDRKIGRLSRQRVPIVADKKRGIVWVVGHSVSDDFRITPDTEGMLLLRARKLYQN